MASIRFYRPIALILLLGIGATRAADQQNPSGLYDRPVLVVDPGTHTAEIRSASADRDGRWVVTGSSDKTVRIWSLADGKLERTIRLPAGPADIGKVYAVAMSPDGGLIAVGGWTRITDADPQEQIYLFDRASGTLLRRIEGLPDTVFRLAFSPDGGRLAAVLGHGGLHIYARDSDYDKPSYGVDFAADGRLATTSFDGKLRLYGADLAGNVHPSIKVDAPGGIRPWGIAFSPPPGMSIAVGYNETPSDRLARWSQPK